MRMKRHLLSTLLLCLISFGAAQQLEGSPITVSFSGHVTSTSIPGLPWHAGDLLTGQFTYDPALGTLGVCGPPCGSNGGGYNFTGSATLGAFSFPISSGGSHSFALLAPSWGYEFWDEIGFTYGGWALDNFHFLGSPAGGSFLVTLSQGPSVSARIDGSTQPIPEPSSLLLLGAGLVGLIATRRRQKRTKVSRL